MAPKPFKDLLAENSVQLAQAGDELRRRFFDWYELDSHEYDDEDVKRLRENDYYCQRFVAHRMGLDGTINSDKILDMVKNHFKWRKEIGANHMKDSDFPEEFFKSCVIAPYKKDKIGNVTTLSRLCKYVKDSKNKEIFRKYLIHVFEKIEVKYDHRKHVTMVVDCKGAGFRQIDLDLAFFFLRTLISNQYPLLLDYCILVDVPSLIAGVWKIVKAWLPQFIVDRLIFVDEKTILNYVDSEDLPEDLGGFDKTVFPMDDPMSGLPESLLTDVETMTIAKT